MVFFFSFFSQQFRKPLKILGYKKKLIQISILFVYEYHLISLIETFSMLKIKMHAFDSVYSVIKREWFLTKMCLKILLSTIMLSFSDNVLEVTSLKSVPMPLMSMMLLLNADPLHAYPVVREIFLGRRPMP